MLHRLSSQLLASMPAARTNYAAVSKMGRASVSYASQQPQYVPATQGSGFRSPSQSVSAHGYSRSQQEYLAEAPNEAMQTQSYNPGPTTSGARSAGAPTSPRSQHQSPSTPSAGLASTLPFPEEASQSYDLPFQYSSPVAADIHAPFSENVSAALSSPIDPNDIEIKSDGTLYMPEIRYRKALTKAFGHGGWCLLPRGPHTLLSNNSALVGSSPSANILTREYALFTSHGRFISQARGSASVPSFSNAAAASESVRSNALMRCCKDLGVANELWDPAFVSAWREEFGTKRVANDSYGRSKVVWARRDNEPNSSISAEDA